MVVKDDADTVGVVLWQHLLGAPCFRAGFCSKTIIPDSEEHPLASSRAVPKDVLRWIRAKACNDTAAHPSFWSISSGKSTLAQGLADRFGLTIYRTREWLSRRLGNEAPSDRSTLQSAGEKLDVQTRGRWVLEELTRELQDQPAVIVVLDSVRTREQIEGLREHYGPKVTHIHVTAPLKVLEQRYDRRRRRERRERPTYDEVRQNPTEREVDSLRDVADVVIDTDLCTSHDVLVRAASHFGLYGRNSMGYVDVLVGGQYGSEGKGQIAAYISQEYDLLVRVGGPNAGHTVFEVPEPYTYHHLPSGTQRSSALLLIGPGAVLNVHGSEKFEIKGLLKEIAERGLDSDRLKIDGQAMVITDDDVIAEEELRRRIGSTRQGVGAATARRIMKRFPETRLARDIPELKPYLCEGIELVSEMLGSGKRVLLEGTQGPALSLYHGYYPHVTSRDTTVAGCLAEAGIAPRLVRRVIMVCRTYPIRVQNPPGGTSGRMSQLTNWAEISRRSSIPYATLLKNERTSTTKRRRRVAEFDWVLLRKATLLNRPTDIALTFTDYLSVDNAGARRFEQLKPETINFIQEVERIAEAPVSLISTGFSFHSIIDRRSW